MHLRTGSQIQWQVGPVELCSLHPIRESSMSEYVDRVRQRLSPSVQVSVGLGSEALGSLNGRVPAGPTERDLQAVTFALAQVLSEDFPVFAAQGLSLTGWEARVDRGISMLIRPPSRLFAEAHIPASTLRSMPIRLDLSFGMMGGGYIPARLIPQVEVLLDRNLKRSLRRMLDADMNAEHLQGMMMEAVRFARIEGTGLYEAVGVVDPFNSETWGSSMGVQTSVCDAALVEQIRQSAKPEPKPGLIERLRARFSD